MIAYNLYYKQTKINKYPVSKDEVITILDNDIIHKTINTQQLVIPTKDLRIIKCTII